MAGCVARASDSALNVSVQATLPDCQCRLHLFSCTSVAPLVCLANPDVASFRTCAQGLSLAVVPALGYAIALGLRRSNFDPHLADGVVIMACMPTTVSTNVVYTQRAAGGFWGV